MTKTVLISLIGFVAILLTSAAPSAAQSAADEAAIRQIDQMWDEAWNRHDPKALASLLAEDADFVNVTGTWYKGRPAFERLMTATHQDGIFKDSMRRTLETVVKFLTPDIAVAHARWTISGDKNRDGIAREPRHGVMTRVVARRDGRWIVVAAHNTNSVAPR